VESRSSATSKQAQLERKNRLLCKYTRSNSAEFEGLDRTSTLAKRQRHMLKFNVLRTRLAGVELEAFCTDAIVPLPKDVVKLWQSMLV
jgi:hypothetical protein